MTAERCCYISLDGQGCDKPAEWEIASGGESTFACTEHAGKLLTDAPCQFVYPVNQPKK